MNYILKKIVCLVFCFSMFYCNATYSLKIISYASNICGLNISDIANFIFKNSSRDTGFKDVRELQKDLRTKYSNNKSEIIICIDDGNGNQENTRKRRNSIMKKNKSFNPRYTLNDFLGVVVYSDVGYDGMVIKKGLGLFAETVVNALERYHSQI